MTTAAHVSKEMRGLRDFQRATAGYAFRRMFDEADQATSGSSSPTRSAWGRRWSPAG